MCVVRGSAIIVVFWRGLRREFQDRGSPEHSPPLGSLEWLLSLSHAHESRRAQGAAMLVFFLPLFPLGVSRFARAIRGRESKAIRSERTLVSQTALLDGQQRSANGLLLENPFYEGVRETHLFATTPLSIKQKITCRPGRGWGPRFDAPGAGRTVRGRSAATRFFGAYCIT